MFIMVMMLPAGVLAQARTLLVLADSRSQLAERFLEQAIPHHPELRVEVQDHWNPRREPADLILAIGSRMLSQIPQDTAVPVMAAFLPLSTVPPSLRTKGNYTFLPLDPDPEQFVDSLTKHLPGIKRAGYLAFDALQRDFSGYLEAARDKGIHAIPMELSQSSIAQALRNLSEPPDAVIILPDPELYRRKLVYQVMLGTFRKGIPAIGTTQNMYRAGAAISIFVTPEACGSETRRLLKEWMEGASLPNGIHYVPELSVLVNRRVMDILGVEAQ